MKILIFHSVKVNKKKTRRLIELTNIRNNINNAIKVKTNQIPIENISNQQIGNFDYTQIYNNYEELFNGYFISRKFNHIKQAHTLLAYFKSLNNTKNYDSDYEKTIQNSINAEAEVIKNRVRQVSEKLIY